MLQHTVRHVKWLQTHDNLTEKVREMEKSEQQYKVYPVDSDTTETNIPESIITRV